MRQEKASSKGSADEAIRQEMEDSACMAEMPAEAARCLAKGKAAEAEAAKDIPNVVIRRELSTILCLPKFSRNFYRNFYLL
jgi:hypothetical protein